LAVADLNGDGKLDLAVVDGNSGVNILLGKGDGTFPQAAQSYATRSFVLSLVVADLDGDGKPDLALFDAGGSDTATILLGTGDGGFQPTQRFATGPRPSSAAVEKLLDDLSDLDEWLLLLLRCRIWGFLAGLQRLLLGFHREDVAAGDQHFPAGAVRVQDFS
jgi:hypothetical protein